ncbi:replication initiation protein [Allofrancisella guangzhouensis]|uniref:replication initiation protein n=1 Tax=Francisellaceae TaxID=34064 RepID=UPI0019051D02|nr:replication initiation protein [Allofrancisella guangzhouensis]MBK2027407.1 replication initiation protein [Allofrancisella guangzhouensis]
MSIDLVKKSFYLTSLFVDIKSEHNWTTNETKMALLLFKELSKYKIYLPELDEFDDSIKELKDRVSKIPLRYTFNRKQFKEITGVANSVLAREIKKVAKGLGSKIISTPHPRCPKDPKSIFVAPWFSKIEYIDDTGDIDLELNHNILERLVAFVKYSKIGFEYIARIQNHNAIYTYLTVKILKDTSKQSSIKMTVSEYKESLGISNKYKALNNLREKVLDVVKKEINEYTDLNFDYKLEKGERGKAYKYITMMFNYKPEYLKQKTKSTNKLSKEPQIIDSFNEVSDSPFEHVLTGWGIRAKKVVEIEETYSLDVIQSAIDLTLEKEVAGEIKTTPAAFFIGTLENKELQSQAEFERQQQIIREQQEKEYQKQLASEYDAIQKFINDNEDELSKYLSAKSLNIEYPLNDSIREQVANLVCVDAEKFKAFRPKLSVLYEGYFDMKQKKEIRPNMYSFLNILKV